MPRFEPRAPLEPWRWTPARRLPRRRSGDHPRVRPGCGADRAVERRDQHLAQVGAAEPAVLEPVEARGLDEADPAAHRDAQRDRRPPPPRRDPEGGAQAGPPPPPGPPPQGRPRPGGAPPRAPGP